MAHPTSMATNAFQTPTDSESEDGSNSNRTPVLGNDIIAGIIADLVSTEDDRFSRPASSHQRNTSVYSFEPLQQSDLDRIRPPSFSSFSIQTSDRTDFNDNERVGRRRLSHTHDFVADVVDSLRQSKHSSLSRPASRHENVADSAVSLFPAKAKHESGLSRAEKEQPSSPSHPPAPEQPRSRTPAPTYPSPAKTAIILISLYISIFLVALDRTIVGPAIPVITDQFKSINDIGWYGSAYMLTSCGFILLYGRIYTFYSTKGVFLSGIILFEGGSAICGAANSSFMLIMGRAIAGLGSSGIFTGAILIMMNTVPLHKRPMLQGLFGACFGVASVAGPLLGGAFTGSKLTWRWCFYINLPLGGFTILVVVLFLKLEENKPRMQTWSQTIKNLDPIGTALFLPAIICLILALEWAAAEYHWSDPRIISLLAVFGVLFAAFVGWQYYTRNTIATVPGRILFQRSVACGGASQFFIGATMLTSSIYIPLWFQAIKGVSAMQSGINTIPLVLSVVVGSISSSALTQRIGYYTPFMILGACFMATGAGLLTTWNMGTGSNKWISFQAILGFGVGCSMQHPNIAVQIVLAKRDVPTGTALLSLCQTLGGAVFVTVGQNTFISKFTAELERIGGIDPEHLVKTGATAIKTGVPESLQRVILEAYNKSLTQGPFFAALIIACLALPAALGMQWRSVKENQRPPSRPSDQDQEKQEQQGPENLFPRDSAERRTGTDMSEDTDQTEAAQLAPPVPAWNKIYRSSGHFSQWMTAKVNPDLRSELSELHSTGHRR